MYTRAGQVNAEVLTAQETFGPRAANSVRYAATVASRRRRGRRRNRGKEASVRQRRHNYTLRGGDAASDNLDSVSKYLLRRYSTRRRHRSKWATTPTPLCPQAVNFHPFTAYLFLFRLHLLVVRQVSDFSICLWPTTFLQFPLIVFESTLLAS